MVMPSTTSIAADEMLSQVCDLIALQCGITRQEITADSKLVDDLGITGADGVELILAFSKRFGVDIRQMNVGQYFGDEGLSLAFWRWRRPLTPIAVSDLVAAAHSKLWPIATSTI